MTSLIRDTSTQVRLTRIMQQQQLDPVELSHRLQLLQLQPLLQNKQAFLEPLQVDLLNRLDRHLREGKAPQEFLYSLKESYLYECENCGDLKLCAYSLQDEGLLHDCNYRRWRLLERTSGRLKLIATGPYDQLLEWAHSISRGLDDPMKGI